MWPSVRAAFYGINVPWEGYVDHFYADVKGLITIGVGNLVDPVVYATQLQMRRADDSFATRDEIIADWARVKNDPEMARKGHRAAALVTKLRLAEADIKTLVDRKLDLNATHVTGRFPGFKSWPADAQMAIMSLAWACGPAFRFPFLEIALRAEDWAAAVFHCQMNEAGNPGLRPRNRANKIMFRNAAWVRDWKLNPEELVYPACLDDDEVTQPEIPSSASAPTIYAVPQPEEVTGSGPIVHKYMFDDEPPDDPDAA